MQAEIDHIQDYFSNFYKNNPVEANANRFSSICDLLGRMAPSRTAIPHMAHNSSYVNMAMCVCQLVQRRRSHHAGHTARAIEESYPRLWKMMPISGPLALFHAFLTGNFPTR